MAISKEERDRELRAFAAAAKEWVKKERDRLDQENKFLSAVARIRGASAAGTQNLVTASSLFKASVRSLLGA